MSRVSTAFIVTDANKAALEAYGVGKAYDCITSRKLRVDGTTGTTPSHWLAHGYTTPAESAVLEAAEDMELISIDVQPVDIGAINHVEQVLTQYGLEFIPEPEE